MTDITRHERIQERVARDERTGEMDPDRVARIVDDIQESSHPTKEEREAVLAVLEQEREAERETQKVTLDK